MANASTTAAAIESRQDITTTIIRPRRGWQHAGLREIWHYRELLHVLSMRDIRIRYKQTIFGIGWAIAQPFMAMVVFSIVLYGAAGVETEPGIPYPVFVYSGLIIWLYFADALSRASKSLVTNNMLVSKVYFPRLIAPLSGILAPILDFIIAFVLLLLIMAFYSVSFSVTLFLAPIFLLAAVLCATAFGTWLAALNVEYRDIAYAVPMALQLWMFLTPVVYPATNVEGLLKLIYALNPMASIVTAFRWSVLGQGEVDWLLFIPSLAVLSIVLASGWMYFRRVERTFADAI